MFDQSFIQDLKGVLRDVKVTMFLCLCYIVKLLKDWSEIWTPKLSEHLPMVPNCIILAYIMYIQIDP